MMAALEFIDDDTELKIILNIHVNGQTSKQTNVMNHLCKINANNSSQGVPFKTNVI